MDLILDRILEDAFDDIVDNAIEDGEVEPTDDEEQMYEVPVDTPEEYNDPYIMYSDDEDEGENDYEDGSTYEVGATDEENDLDTIIADLDARIAGEDPEEYEEDIFVQESASMKGDNFLTFEDGDITLEAFDRFISESYLLNNTIEIPEFAIFTEGAKLSDAIKKVKDFFAWIWSKIVQLYETIKRKIIDFINGDLWLEKKAKEFKNAKVNMDEVDESAMLEAIIKFPSNHKNSDSNDKKKKSKPNSSEDDNKNNDSAPSKSEDKPKQKSSEDDNKDNSNSSHKNSEGGADQPRSRINLIQTQINILNVPEGARHTASALLYKSLKCDPKTFMKAIEDIDRADKEAIVNKCKNVLGMDINITFNHELPKADIHTDKRIVEKNNKDVIEYVRTPQIITSTIEAYVYNEWFKNKPQNITIGDALMLKSKYCDQYLTLRNYITNIYGKSTSIYSSMKNAYLAEISNLEKQVKSSYNKHYGTIDEAYYDTLQKMREVCNIHTTAIKSNLNAIARCISIEYRNIRSVLFELMVCAGFFDRRSLNKVTKSANDPVSIINY